MIKRPDQQHELPNDPPVKPAVPMHIQGTILFVFYRLKWAVIDLKNYVALVCYMNFDQCIAKP